MNDTRRKEIQRAQMLIGEAKGILEVAATQERDDFDKMPRTSKTMMRGKERRRRLTHWSLPQCAVTRRWQNVRSDGSTTLDVRLVLKTTDDALIGMTYRGIRHGAPDVIARLERGETVDPATTISALHRSSRRQQLNMPG
jgi:Protein of unknown function (DUF3237)